MNKHTPEIVGTIEKGYFYKDGLRIIYNQPSYKMSDGSTCCSLNAPVCDIWEDLVEPQEVAKEICHKLNCHDDLLEALEYMVDMHEGEPVAMHVLEAINKAKGIR